MEIHPVADALIRVETERTDQRTYMMNQIRSFHDYTITPKNEEPITVFITQMQTYKVKNSDGGLIKSLLNCGDTMIKSWKTAAFTQSF